jgi:hypothetical protein
VTSNGKSQQKSKNKKANNHGALNHMTQAEAIKAAGDQ